MSTEAKTTVVLGGVEYDVTLIFAPKEEPPPPPPPGDAKFWSDPATWPSGAVPGPADDVVIPAGQTVLIDDLDAEACEVDVQGTLIFEPSEPTRLKVCTLMVEGLLQIGTAQSPALDAEVIFMDMPMTAGPMGNGLIVTTGELLVHGKPKTAFTRLLGELPQGSTSFACNQTGWEVGDTIYLPDSRQLNDNPFSGYANDRANIASVPSTVGLLSSQTTVPHPGARDGDGNLDCMPHVGNLTRSVVFRSENPNGVRGHVMVTGSGRCDIRYAAFVNLGRTTTDMVSEANPAGFYPLHMHHLDRTDEEQDRFTLIGNVVQGDGSNRKWGIVVHDSDNGLIEGNIVLDVQGAGIVTETGEENNNVFRANWCSRINGTGSRIDDQRFAGTSGDGFWFHGSNNHSIDNVASNCLLYGHVWWHGGPLLEVEHPVSYGGRSGLTPWFLNEADTGQANPNAPQSTIKNCELWHNWYTNIGLGYPAFNLTFDGGKIRGAPGQLSQFGFWWGDYQARNFILRNLDIQGCMFGIDVPRKAGIHRVPPDFTITERTDFIIEDCFLRNWWNIYCETPSGPGNGAGLAIPPRHAIVRNVTYGAPLTGYYPPQGPGQLNIWMSYRDYPGQNANFIVDDVVEVVGYNGVAGDDFRLYYPEARGDFVLPKSTPDNNTVGSPVGSAPGLTNQQNWDTYGVALAGSVAPSTATTLAKIIGLVEHA